jgi:hypothetical protein
MYGSSLPPIGGSEAPRGRREGGRMDGGDEQEKRGAEGICIKMISALQNAYQSDLTQP